MTKTLTPTQSRRLASIGKYLRLMGGRRGWPVKPLSAGIKTKVRKAYVELASNQGFMVLRAPTTRPDPRNPDKTLNVQGFKELNDERRGLLAEAIFVVENEIESRGDGQRHNRTVITLNAIRNRLYDEIGVNEQRDW